MTASKQMNLKSAIAFGILLGLGLASCEKAEEMDPPVLPPIESMLMDFSDFEQGTAKSATALKSNTYYNWGYSAFTVGIWNLVATGYSIIPVKAYLVALDQDAEYLGDQQWEWSYEFQLEGISYKATLLAARLNNEAFSAEMRIGLAAMPKQGVKWFDGVIRYDHTHASWTIYEEGLTQLLGIEWNKDFESGMADLTYTALEVGSPEEGSYIMWMTSPGEALDASFDISTAESMVQIQWNTESLEGRVKSPAHFEDELWHCWNSRDMGLADMDCE